MEEEEHDEMQMRHQHESIDVKIMESTAQVGLDRSIDKPQVSD